MATRGLPLGRLARLLLVVVAVGLGVGRPAHAAHVAATGNEEAICTRASVLLCENFEDRPTGTLTAAQWGAHQYKHNGWAMSELNSQTTVTAEKHDGVRSLQHAHAATPRAGDNGGGGFMDTTIPGGPKRELYARFYVKFSSDWVWSPNGQKIMFLSENAGRVRTMISHTQWGADITHLTDSHGNIWFPNVNAGAGSLGLNTWKCVESRMRTNTVLNGVAQPDGIFQQWVDDVLSSSFLNLSTLTTASATTQGFLDNIMPSGYWNCVSSNCLLSSNTHPAMERWIDRIVVSTERIGCSGTAPTQDAVNPAGSVVAPVASATLPSTQTITVSASDAGSGVASVRMLIGGANFIAGSGCESLLMLPSTGTTASGTWSCSFTTATYTNQTVNLAATVTDAAGNAITTANVSVTISNTPVDPTVPVAFWKFNEAPAAGTAQDETANNLDLTLANGADFTAKGCLFYNCAGFDGVNDTATAPVSALLHRTTAFTIVGIVNPTSTATGTVFDHGASATSPHTEYALGLDQGKAYCQLNTGGTLQYVYSTTSIVIGAKTLLACTWGGSTLRIFVGGLEEASLAVTGTITAITNSTTVGYRSAAPADYYAGTIDHLAVWSRALTAAEVLAILGTPVTPPPPPPPTPGAIYGDTYLNLNGVNYAATPETKLYLWQDAGASRRHANVVLVKTDLTAIPPAATVSACTITHHLLETARVSGTVNVALHAVTGADPRIGEATGRNADNGTGWAASTSTGLGDGAWPMATGDLGSALATTDIGTTPGPKTWSHANLTTQCQTWVTTPSTNKGYVLVFATSLPVDAYASFASHEHPDAALRPMFVVTQNQVPTPTTTRSVELRWTAVPDASGYSLERKLTAGGTYAVIAANLAPTVTTYTDTGLAASTVYVYRLRAFVRVQGGEVYGSYSSEASVTTAASVAVPRAPAINPLARADSTLGVNWVDRSDVETAYRVERQISTGSFAVLTSAAANVQGYTDGATPRAADQVIQYEASPEVFTAETTDAASSTANDVTLFPATEAAGDRTITCSSEPFSFVRYALGTAGVGGTVTWRYWTGPTTLANLSGVIDGTNGFLNSGTTDVTWTAPTDWTTVDFDGTDQFSNPPAYCVAAEVATTYSTNPLADQVWVFGLLDGLDYCYRVAATNSAGTSPYSAVACGRTITAPATPGGLTGTPQ